MILFYLYSRDIKIRIKVIDISYSKGRLANNTRRYKSRLLLLLIYPYYTYSINYNSSYLVYLSLRKDIYISYNDVSRNVFY